MDNDRRIPGNDRRRELRLVDLGSLPDRVGAAMELLADYRAEWVVVRRPKRTDTQVEEAMWGHAMWDDPPPDWSKSDLLMWSRGYLHAEAVHRGSASGVLRVTYNSLRGPRPAADDHTPPASEPGGEETSTRRDG